MLTMAYAFLFLFALILLIKYIKSGKRFVTTAFMAVFTVYYIIVPGMLSLYSIAPDPSLYLAPHLVVISRADSKDKIIAFLITLFVFCLLALLNNTKITLNKVKSARKIENVDKNMTEEKLNRKIFYLGIFFTVIGALCIAEIAIELGGIKNMISLGSTIRGYRTNNADYISPIGAMCKTLAIFSTGGFFCIYASRKQSIFRWVFLIFSFSVSLIYLLFNSGRAPLLLFFGCIVFSIFRERGIKTLWMVVCAFLAVMLLSKTVESVMRNIALGNYMFQNIQYSFSENIFATIADFAFPYANILSLPDMISFYDYNYGVDYLTWIFEILPSRIFSIMGINVPQFTLVTIKVSRYYLDSGLSLGGTPADFITYGWFQGNIFGLTLNCVIFGCLLRRIDDVIENLPMNFSVIVVRMCFLGYSLITSSDFALVIKNNLFLFVIMVVLYIATRNKQLIREERNAKYSLENS